jgi:hypothetical protein
MLYDHSSFQTVIQNVDPESYRFVFPLSSFEDGHIYSLHVMTEQLEYFHSIDFQEGLAAFRYEGGAGADLGELSMSYESFGAVELSQPAGALAGGFSLYRGISGRLQDLERPPELSALSLRAELAMGDRAAVLGAFLNDGGEETANTLANWSSLVVDLEAADGVTISSAAFESSAGVGSRMRQTSLDELLPFGQAASSALSGSGLERLSNTRFASRFLTGQVLFQQQLAFLQLTLPEARSLSIPVVFQYVFSAPPLPISVAYDGGPETTFQFTDLEANGLAQPLCKPASLLAIRFEGPTRLDGLSVFAEGSIHAELSLKYRNAVTLDEVEPIFAAGYDETAAWTGGEGETYEWIAATQLLLVQFPDNIDSFPVEIPAALLSPLSPTQVQVDLQFGMTLTQGGRTSIPLRLTECP